MASNLFKLFYDIAKQKALENGHSLNELEKKAQDLLYAFYPHNFLRMLPLKVLSLSDYTWAVFLSLIMKKKGFSYPPVSPVVKQNNSAWMVESSFCFINVRAIGLKPCQTGSFIQAQKILPTLRVNSIHLAPFFECALEIIYGADSLQTPDKNVIDSYYLSHGLGATEQVRLFTEIAHLLGKTVGFDLEPHTSQFSRVAISHPKLFRWIRLDSNNKNQLADGLTELEILKNDYQKNIFQSVSEIREQILQKYGLDYLDIPGMESVCKEAHQEIIRVLIDKGLWTLPSHTWKGAGLPEFSHYVNYGHIEYPEFKYISTDGENHREHAFGTLTPFRFYDGLPLNSIPSNPENIKRNNDVCDYFYKIFPEIYKTFNFDYIRFDYIDHVYDSVLNGDQDKPVSDRITPRILKNCVETAREKVGPYIGAMAERMGQDVENYGNSGFDLLLGDDIFKAVSFQMIEDQIKLNHKLEKFNRLRSRPVSVQFAVDTHDSGHPLFNLTPMLKYGRLGVVQRLFISRFLQWKNAPRPKYEVLGNQDGTTGLYQANNKVISLKWKNDKKMNRLYHRVEDMYDKFSDFIKDARYHSHGLIRHHTFYWVLENGNQKLIAIINTGITQLPFRLKLPFDLNGAKVWSSNGKEYVLHGNRVRGIQSKSFILIHIG